MSPNGIVGGHAYTVTGVSKVRPWSFIASKKPNTLTGKVHWEIALVTNAMLNARWRPPWQACLFAPLFNAVFEIHQVTCTDFIQLHSTVLHYYILHCLTLRLESKVRISLYREMCMTTNYYQTHLCFPNYAWLCIFVIYFFVRLCPSKLFLS